MPSTARQFVPGGRRGTRGKHQQWAEEHLQSRESESNIGQTRKLEKWQNGSICRTCTCRAAEEIFRIMWTWWHEYLFSFLKKKIPALGHWDCSCWALHGHPAVQSRVVVLAHSCAAVWWWLCSHSCELVSVASLHMSQIRLSPALLIAASTTTLSLICSSFKSLFSALIPWKWVCVPLALLWDTATTPEAAAPPLGTQFPCYAPEKYSMYTRTPLILKRCPEERESKQWLLPSDTETWAFLLDFLRRHPPVVMWRPHRADKGCRIKLSVCWAQPWLRSVHRCHTPMPSVPGRGSHSWVTCPRVTKGLTLCLHHSSASLSFGASRIHCLDSRQIRYGKGIIWKYNYIKGKEKKNTTTTRKKPQQPMGEAGRVRVTFSPGDMATGGCTGTQSSPRAHSVLAVTLVLWWGCVASSTSTALGLGCVCLVTSVPQGMRQENTISAASKHWCFQLRWSLIQFLASTQAAAATCLSLQ